MDETMRAGSGPCTSQSTGLASHSWSSQPAMQLQQQLSQQQST